MDIGTASAERGERATGWLSGTDLPTGGVERLPVTIVAGSQKGKTLWVTASLHGDEVTPLAVAQEFSRLVSPADLRGTLVCLPVANPAGLRLTTRRSYYHRDDPNRYFPALDREGVPETEDRTRPPRTQEAIDRRIYDAVSESADALCDLHTAGIDSCSYLIRDQVLFGAGRSREAAEDLNERYDALVNAIGLPVVNEYPVPEYFERNFHRTLSGSALNTCGIPAATLELGGHTVIDDGTGEIALAGLSRVLVALDMLDSKSAIEASETASTAPPEAPVFFPVRRYDGPRVSSVGIVRHSVSAGDAVAAGDVVAEVVTPHGDVIETVESAHDGYVLARKPGVSVYANDAICSLAVRDESDRVVSRTK